MEELNGIIKLSISHRELKDYIDHPKISMLNKLTITCDTDEVIDIDLSCMPNLKRLHIAKGNCNLHITKNTKLRHIHLTCKVNNKLDMSLYPDLVYLRMMRIYEDIDLSKNAHLQTLALYHCHGSIDLSHNHKLRRISIGYRSTVCVDLTNKPYLHHIHLMNNQDHILDLPSYKRLDHLGLHHADYELDLTQNTDLDYIVIDQYNHPLDLSQNSKLEGLCIYSSYDHCLEIDHLTNLCTLILKSYQYILNLSNLKKLCALHLYDYDYKIDVSQNTNLNILTYISKQDIDLSKNDKLRSIAIGNDNGDVSIPINANINILKVD